MQFLVSTALLVLSYSSVAHCVGNYNSIPFRAAMERFEQSNVEAILWSDRLLSSYADCLLDTGKCNRNAQDLKSVLPEILRTKCLHCTPIQRAKALKVMTHLSIHKPELWRRLREKYAPKMDLKDFNLRKRKSL